jgi:hypothetical protein
MHYSALLETALQVSHTRITQAAWQVCLLVAETLVKDDRLLKAFLPLHSETGTPFRGQRG